MNNIIYSESKQEGEFTVVKTTAAAGYKKITDYTNDEEFEYEGERYVVVKKYNGRGNVLVRRLSDSKGFKMTPFTIVKII